MNLEEQIAFTKQQYDDLMKEANKKGMPLQEQYDKHTLAMKYFDISEMLKRLRKIQDMVSDL